jgi:pimeloyl-ACP methyl ester carboxylesterase
VSVPSITRLETVATSRLTTRVLFHGPDDGIPVLFLHGNLTSATWWEETMVALPPGYRAVAPDQRGYGSADPAAKIDATRGMGDLADDAIALLDHLGVDKAHLVGNSLGGCVAWSLLAEHPDRWLTITQADAGSPFGYAATKDAAGTITNEEYSGSGAGLINPEVVRLVAAKDRTTDSPFTVRSALRQLIVKPPFIPAREDALVESMLEVHLGEQDYPGDAVSATLWPGVGPGVWGSNNGLSPKYYAVADAVAAADPRPPVLWVRGENDLMVSDAAMADPGTLGGMGLIPGYPGADVYPPQPMLGQIRAMLDRYAAAGGSYAEEVIADCGHVPFIEKPNEFNQMFHAHLRMDG